MSTENKCRGKKVKRISEKDQRMAQLKKEIARLELENKVLKRDSAEYENRLQTALLRGVTAFNNNRHTFLNYPFDEGASTSSKKSYENPEDALTPEKTANNRNRGKATREKTNKNLKKIYANTNAKYNK